MRIEADRKDSRRTDPANVSTADGTPKPDECVPQSAVSTSPTSRYNVGNWEGFWARSLGATSSEMPAAPRLTVTDLVSDPSLGLNVVGGRSGLKRQISSVHVIYNRELLSWITPETLVLTMDPPPIPLELDGAKLVEGLSDLGMAGLGVGLFQRSTALPADMVAAADRLAFPVLTISPNVSFQRFIRHVLERLVAADLYQLKRVVRAQELLMVVDDEDEVQRILTTAQDLVDATVVRLDRRGCTLNIITGPKSTSPGSETIDGLWVRYLEARSPLEDSGSFVLDGREILFAEIRMHGAVWQVLFLVSEAGAQGAVLAEDVLRFTRRLLQLDVVARLGSSKASSTEQRELLRALLLGESAGQETVQRLALLGFPSPFELRVIVLCRVDAAPQQAQNGNENRRRRDRDLESVLASVGDRLDALGLPSLFGSTGDAIAVVVPDAPEAPTSEASSPREAAEALRVAAQATWRAGDVAAGVSLLQSDLGRMRSALTQALLAVRQSGPTGPVVAMFDEISDEFRVLEATAGEELLELRSRVIDALRKREPAEATQYIMLLARYLANDGSVSKTAEDLYMHRNTVRRRLSHVSELLGVDLASFRDLLSIRLSLAAHEVLEVRKLLP